MSLFGFQYIYFYFHSDFKLSGQGQKTVLLSLLEYGRLLALASGGIPMYFAEYGTCILVSTPIWILRAKNCALRCPDVNLILLKKRILICESLADSRTECKPYRTYCLYTITSLKISNVYEKCQFNIGDLTYWWILQWLHNKTYLILISFPFIRKPILFRKWQKTFKIILLSSIIIDQSWKKIAAFF